MLKLTNSSYFKFSGGEVHCRNKEDFWAVTCLDYSMDGFMALCEYHQIMRRKGKTTIDLTYPYLPYARQDREMNNEEPFSLKIFCDLLNTQQFNSVTIWDPHSDVAPALINKCKIYTQSTIANACLPSEYFVDRSVLFVSPDAGAYKKLSKLVGDDTRIIVGTKQRNFRGEITHTDIVSGADIKGKTCVMVDDICDGGRTFIELAKVLRARGAEKIVLYVTHGIFSKGFDELKEHIDIIYTTNSFPHIPTSFLVVKELI